MLIFNLVNILYFDLMKHYNLLILLKILVLYLYAY